MPSKNYIEAMNHTHTGFIEVDHYISIYMWSEKRTYYRGYLKGGKLIGYQEDYLYKGQLVPEHFSKMLGDDEKLTFRNYYIR